MTRPRALGAYIFAGGFTVGVREHFEVLAHLEGDGAYGASCAQANFPGLEVRSGPADWRAADFAGVDFVYCNPPCFSWDTKVLTEYGPVPIIKLVRERSTARVLSYDEASGVMTYRRITGWHENPYAGDLYDVRMVNWAKGGRKASRARATADHRFLTRRGWKRVVELREHDEVCTGLAAPNDRQLALLDGMMLGDSTIKKHQAQLWTMQVSQEYVELKKKALSAFVCQGGVEVVGADWGDGYERKPRAWFYLRTDGWTKRERARWYGPDGKKRVPKDIELSPLTLAAWYMDDGTLRSGKTTAADSGAAHLCTDSFSEDDVGRLLQALKNLGIVARRIRHHTYTRISIPAAGIHTFVDKIGAYVLPEMRYKLPPWAPAFDPSLWELGEPVVDWDRVVVTRAKRSARANVYCLDVAETHNFVTYGGVVHNCAIFSQAGASAVQSLDWRDDPRISCWRECFGLLEELRPRAWVLESVSQAYSRGRELVDELTRRALLMGYSVTHLLEDARWFGLPQRRKRFLLVCHMPARLAAPGLNFAPPPGVMDVLGLVDDPGRTSALKPEVLELLPHVPAGVSLRRVWEERGKPTRGGPPFLQYRLAVGAPRHAFVGDHCFHPVEHRRLGEAEMRAVCGFPSDFVLDGGQVGANASLLARGVMPPVAEWLARKVAETLEGPDAAWEERRVTLVDLLEPGRDPVDLTAEYLTPSGKLRMRARAESAPSSELAPGPAAVYDSGEPEEDEVEQTAVTVVAPAPLQGEGSGKYMQRLWMTTRMTPDEIVAAVHASWQGRTTKVSDCYYNYKILVKEGKNPRQWSSSSSAERPARRVAQPKPVDAECGAQAPTATAFDPGWGDVAAPARHVAQPTRANIRDVPDADAREYDTTSLTETSHGYKVHRDYAAHFFRWGFVRRHVGNADRVLEIGCGADFPFRKSITYPMHVPARYVGVDLNPLTKAPNSEKFTFHGSFNFNERYAELGREFNVILSLEVIEHMTRAHGDELLRGAKHCLEPGGVFYLSTPVFNGYAAANHIHEYTVNELREAVEAAGFRVVRRFGTFANQADLKKVATAEQLATLRAINEYYSTDVTACFLAPLYPDASRNNLWVLEHA